MCFISLEDGGKIVDEFDVLPASKPLPTTMPQSTTTTTATVEESVGKSISKKKKYNCFFQTNGGIIYSFLSNSSIFLTHSCSRLFFSNCSSLLACCQRVLFDNCDHFCSACGGSSVCLLCLRRGGRQQTICASFATLQFEQQFCVVAQREQRRFAASRQQIGSLCSQTIAFATRFVGRNL